jgi:hypothetical protein
MPFENASNLESWNEQASNKKGSSGSHAKYSDRKTSTISNRAILYESLLSNANRSQRRSLKNTEFSEHWRWAIPVILMLVGTVGLFIYTDKRQKQQVVERSKIEQAVEQQ